MTVLRRYVVGFPFSTGAFSQNVVKLARTKGVQVAYDWLHGAFARNSAKTSALLTSVGIFLAIALFLLQEPPVTTYRQVAMVALFASGALLTFNLFTVWWVGEPGFLGMSGAEADAYLVELSKLFCRRVAVLTIGIAAFGVGLIALFIDLCIVLFQ